LSVVTYEIANGAYARAAGVRIWSGIATVVIDDV
jgi:hypothetical protein